MPERRPECLLCGGSVTGRLFDTTCAHVMDEPPEPVLRLHRQFGDGELYWWAFSPEPVVGPVAHPTHDGAIEAYRERWHEAYPTREDKLRALGHAPESASLMAQADARQPVDE